MSCPFSSGKSEFRHKFTKLGPDLPAIDRIQPLDKLIVSISEIGPPIAALFSVRR